MPQRHVPHHRDDFERFFLLLRVNVRRPVPRYFLLDQHFNRFPFSSLFVETSRGENANALHVVRKHLSQIFIRKRNKNLYHLIIYFRRNLVELPFQI